jgi:hypothetical protein
VYSLKLKGTGRCNDDDDDDYDDDGETYQERIKSTKYRNQPYWARHTYFGKY